MTGNAVSKKEMRQEVNLYLPELRKQFDPLSPHIAIAACMAIAGLLFALGLLSYWQNTRIANEIEVLAQQKQQLDDAVVQLRKAAPKSQAAKLIKQLDALKGKAEGRRVIKRIISGQNLGNARGFSGHFYGFSRQIGSDVSLQSFQLTRGGAHVEMQGYTRKASAVPRLLELLQGEANFQQVTFGQLNIARKSEDDVSKEMRFSLGRRFDNPESQEQSL